MPGPAFASNMFAFAFVWTRARQIAESGVRHWTSCTNPAGALFLAHRTTISESSSLDMRALPGTATLDVVPVTLSMIGYVPAAVNVYENDPPGARTPDSNRSMPLASVTEWPVASLSSIDHAR